MCLPGHEHARSVFTVERHIPVQPQTPPGMPVGIQLDRTLYAPAPARVAHTHPRQPLAVTPKATHLADDLGHVSKPRADKIHLPAIVHLHTYNDPVAGLHFISRPRDRHPTLHFRCPYSDHVCIRFD